MKNLMKIFLAITMLWSSLATAQNQMPGTTLKLGSKTTTNKDIIFDINQSAANPRLRANGSTQKLQYTNDGTNFSDIGSGSGGGGAKNYITTGNAETGNTTGFALYDDGAATRPVDGTGGTATGVTFTNTTTNPLMDTASFVLAKDAANRQGKGVSYDFTIDAAQKAKVLSIKTKYRVDSGTFVPGTTGSSPTDGDLIVYLYDVTNSTLIEPSSIKFLSSSTTISDEFSANFQTPSNSTSYRLIYHIASTSALAWNLKIDDIEVSPSKYIYGTPITDWVAYTPTFTGFGTVTSPLTFWRRVGDTLEVTGTFTTGTTTGTQARISLPAGMTTEGSSKLSGPGTTVCGDVIVGSASTTYFSTKVLCLNSLTYVTFGSQTSLTSATNQVLGNTFSNTTSFLHKFSVPIAGWSSSVIVSSEADTRVVAARVNTSTTTVTGSQTTIVYTSVAFDTHGAYNTGTGKYTAPVPGKYRVSATFVSNNQSQAAGSSAAAIYISKNGAAGAVPLSTNVAQASITVRLTASGSDTIDLIAGDTVEIKAIQSSSGALNAGAENYFAIERISGPQAIAASETVAFRYTNTAGTTFATGAAVAIVPFANKIEDTHATSVVGGVFTAQAGGLYDCSSYFDFTGTSMANGTTFQTYLYKNGSPAAQTAHQVPTLGTGSWYGSVSALLRLIIGDTVDVRFTQNSTATVTLRSTAHINHFTCKRIGL